MVPWMSDTLMSDTLMSDTLLVCRDLTEEVSQETSDKLKCVGHQLRYLMVDRSESDTPVTG